VKKLRIYLDNCCYNRPYDDQTNQINHLETEAKLAIQNVIREQKVELVWSFVLDFENNDNPFIERKERIKEWRQFAVVDCELCDEIKNKAASLIKLGLRQKDASHIASAIHGNADYFITTDNKILNKNVSETVLINPIDFLRRYLENDN
jgi:predicted nucleic acid-binding protein